jgi:hypothetical protein
MEIRFLEVAQQELDEAVEYYNRQSQCLGDQFCLKSYWLDRITKHIK